MFNNNSFGRGGRNPSLNCGQFVPSTNKHFVRSLEEALSLPANFNSQNVYFDVNEDVLYDVCTNGLGEKSWTIFGVTLLKSSASQTFTPVAASNTEERLKNLEVKLEELLNGKYNVKQAEPADTKSV